MENRGIFVVFEGIDGSGKSTQLELLTANLAAYRGSKADVYATAEPTFTATGGLVRDVFNGKTKRCASELAALFLADRIDHNVNEKYGIKHYVEKGIDVVCDRYYYSTFAYQNDGSNLEWLLQGNLGCSEIMRPDVCFFIDVSAEECARRMTASRAFKDENEESISRLRSNREKYLRVIDYLGVHDEYGENIYVIDGMRPSDAIAEEIFSITLKIIKQIRG